MNRRDDLQQTRRSGLRQLWALPYSDPGWPGKVLLGSALLLLWPLVAPLLLVLGYLVALARLSPSKTALPSWRSPGSMLRDGGRLALSMLAYGWPALFVLSTVAVGGLVIEGPLGGSRAAGALVALAVTVQPIGLVWLLVGLLLFPLQLRRAAATESLAQALSPTALFSLARANLRRLPVLWLSELALLLAALPGLLLALVGYAFTLFWALLAVARLSATLEASE